MTPYTEQIKAAEQSIAHFNNMTNELMSLHSGQCTKDSLATTANHHMQILRNMLILTKAYDKSFDTPPAPSPVRQDPAIKESYPNTFAQG